MQEIKCPDCGKVFVVDEEFMENKLQVFKEETQYKYSNVETKLKNVMKKIEETITKYEETQENLKEIEKQIYLANEKLRNLSIKNLLRDNPIIVNKVENKGRAPLSLLETKLNILINKFKQKND